MSFVSTVSPSILGFIFMYSVVLFNFYCWLCAVFCGSVKRMLVLSALRMWLFVSMHIFQVVTIIKVLLLLRFVDVC